VRPLVVVAVAHLIAGATIVIVAAATRSFGVERGYLPWAIAAGAVGLVSLVAFYGALSTGKMGIVAPIAGTGAVVPVVYGLLHGESPSGWQVAGIAAAVGGEIILIPPLQLGRRRQRHLARRLAADQITAHRDQRLAALRPHGGNDVGRSRAPIKTADGGFLDLERVHQIDDVDSDHRLLAVARRIAG